MRVARAWLALVPLLGPALSGCGFHPLYGSGNGTGSAAAETELSTIRVDTIADRQGQELRNFLIDDLQGEGVPPPPEHELIVSYSESQADLGLNNDATTTRGQLTVAVTFTLKNLKTGVNEMTNTAQEITGYNIQQSEFATILSRDDAEQRALRAVADNMQLRLALYFRNTALHRHTNSPVTPGIINTAPAQPSFGQTATPLATHAPGETLDNQTPITQTTP